MADEVKKLKLEIKSYTRQVQDLQNDIDELKNKAKRDQRRYETTINNLNFELETAKTTKASGSSDEMKRELELVRKQLEDKANQLILEQALKAKLEQQLTEISNKDKDYQKELKEAQEKYEFSEKSKVLLDKELRDLETELLDELDAKAVWEKEKRDLVFEVEQLRIEKETAIRQRSRVEEERRVLESEIDKLKKKNSAMNEQSINSEVKVLKDMLEKEITAKVKAEQDQESLRNELEFAKKKNRELQFSAADATKQANEATVFLQSEKEARNRLDEANKQLQQQFREKSEILEKLKEELQQGDASLKRSVIVLTEKVEYHKQQEIEAQGEKLKLNREIQSLKTQLYEQETILKKQDRQLDELKGSTIGDLSNELAHMRKKAMKLESEKYDLEEQLRKHMDKWSKENELRLKLEKQKKKQNLIIKELKKKLAVADGEELTKVLANLTDPRAIRAEMLTEVQQLLETLRKEISRRHEMEELAERLKEELIQLKIKFGLIKDPNAIEEEAEVVVDPIAASEERKKFEELVSFLSQTRQPPFDEMDGFDDGSGMTDIFYIDGPSQFPLPVKENGQFFSGHGYVINYTSLQVDQEVVYYWIGSDCPPEERKSTEFHAKQLKDKLKNSSHLVGITEGREPKHFLSIFKGRMTIFSGRKSDYDPSQNLFLMIIGTRPDDCRVVECGYESAMLNSLNTCVIQSPDVLYVWMGDQSADFEQEVASELASKFQGHRSLMNIMQGSETEDFWEALGGEDVFMTSDDFDRDWKPLFFQVYPSEDHLEINEIFAWAQEDLLPDHLILFDAGKEMYIWMGADTPNKDQSKKKLMEVTQEYVKRNQDSRPVDTKIIYIKQDNEGPKFTRHFKPWKKDFWKDRKYISKVEKRAAEIEAKEKSAEEILNEYKKTFPYEQLKSRTNLPAFVDLTKLENHLREDEFESVFGMTREEFSKAPAWKVNKLKRQKGLF